MNPARGQIGARHHRADILPAEPCYSSHSSALSRTIVRPRRRGGGNSSGRRCFHPRGPICPGLICCGRYSVIRGRGYRSPKRDGISPSENWPSRSPEWPASYELVLVDMFTCPRSCRAHRWSRHIYIRGGVRHRIRQAVHRPTGVRQRPWQRPRGELGDLLYWSRSTLTKQKNKT